MHARRHRKKLSLAWPENIDCGSEAGFSLTIDPVEMFPQGSPLKMIWRNSKMI